ncbi:unnamed protein product [Leuciscus chuanchicus]
MASIKEESEDMKIEETFRVKQEDTEEQTDLMALKEEGPELNDMEGKDQYENYHDFMAGEKSTETEKSSSRKRRRNKSNNAPSPECVCHGWGKGDTELTPLDERLAAIIGESLLSGVVTEAEGDTDTPDAPDDTVGPVVLMLQLSSRLDPASLRHAALNPPAAAVSSAMQSSKCRVINSIREVAKELGEIKTVLTEISCTMREFLSK